MTYSSLIHLLPRMLRKEDALDYVGGQTMLKDLGVRPTVQKKGITLYDRLKLDKALDALNEVAELPDH
jgi:hypothetical protein